MHFPSNSNLETATGRSQDDPDLSDLPDRPNQDTSLTITHAINHLESLLGEVDRLSYLVGVPEDAQPQPQTPNSPSNSRKRRPSEDIMSKGNKYLDTANPKRQPTIRFAEPHSPQIERQPTSVAADQISTGDAVVHHVHGKAEGTKSAPAPPIVSTPGTGPGLEYLTVPKAIRHRSRSTGELEVLEPRPINTPRRPSSDANLKQEIKDYLRKHTEISVTDRTTFSLSPPAEKHEQHVGSDLGAATCTQTQ